ncbi:hypothetical protein [Rubritalea squalenifaciens]|uniref:hypothetical protein n=1 Tax=Rubritalea squalenifaciens TaxID=407226 RepID=UPI00116111F1|nr:hypothetical protein [Rubritalea squalenifaciens]
MRKSLGKIRKLLPSQVEKAFAEAKRIWQAGEGVYSRATPFDGTERNDYLVLKEFLELDEAESLFLSLLKEESAILTGYGILGLFLVESPKMSVNLEIPLPERKIRFFHDPEEELSLSDFHDKLLKEKRIHEENIRRFENSKSHP